jgi:hypothetical protein
MFARPNRREICLPWGLTVLRKGTIHALGACFDPFQLGPGPR